MIIESHVAVRHDTEESHGFLALYYDITTEILTLIQSRERTFPSPSELLISFYSHTFLNPGRR